MIFSALQLWFNDIAFNEDVKYDIENKHIYPLKDQYGYKIIVPLVNIF